MKTLPKYSFAVLSIEQDPRCSYLAEPKSCSAWFVMPVSVWSNFWTLCLRATVQVEVLYKADIAGPSWRAGYGANKLLTLSEM